MGYDKASELKNVTRYADLGGTQLVADSSYIYDNAGRLTNLTHKRGTTTFFSYTFDYDAANRITKFTSPDGTSDYSYDDTNQLTLSDHSFQADEAYSYDANGNRTNNGYQTGVDNKLQSDGKYNYEYDSEGNRTKRTEIATGEVTEYVWDYRNRLTQVVTKNAGNITKEANYTYFELFKVIFISTYFVARRSYIANWKYSDYKEWKPLIGKTVLENGAF